MRAEGVPPTLLTLQQLRIPEEQGGARSPSLSPRSERSSAEIKIRQSAFVQKKTGSFSEYYAVLRQISSTEQGQVYQVQHRATQELRVMKVINKRALRSQGLEQSQFLSEVELLKHLDHPNILRVFEFFEDAVNYRIIQEFVEGEELFDLLVNTASFSERDAALIMQQVLSALSYAHKRNIVHRDIKADNILVTKEKNGAGEHEYLIKIIDWGFATYQDPQFSKLRLRCGTLDYNAPEVFQGEYNEKRDIWSAGCLLYAFVANRPPFFADTDAELQSKILIGKIDLQTGSVGRVSAECKDLIKKLLTYRYQQRVSAEEALQHPWFAKALQDVALSQELPREALQRLKSYRAESKLKEAVYSYVASQLLSEKEKQSFRNSFTALDRNKDGQLSKEEIIQGYEEFQGLPHEFAVREAESIMLEADMDKSGSIDYNEFIAVMVKRHQALRQQRLRQAFSLFDQDGDGFITSQEIQNIIGDPSETATDKSSGPTLWQELVAEADENGDGKISFEEFEKFMQTLERTLSQN